MTNSVPVCNYLSTTGRAPAHFGHGSGEAGGHPPAAASLSLRSPNLPNFLQAPHFAVNILAEDQLALARRFAQAMPKKFDGVSYRPGTGGVPLLPGAAAQLECRNETRYYSGDHVIFIGHVLRYAWRECTPLVFCRGRYGTPRGDNDA